MQPPRLPMPCRSGITLLLAVPLLAVSLHKEPAFPSLAQVEKYMLKRGSQVGPATKVKPTNCVTAPDGSITCDTELENPPGDTQAKPQFNPFKN
jgi:hypothetical protein